MPLLETTKAALRAIIDGDLSATKEERAALKSAINNPTRAATGATLPRVISRKEFMQITGLSHSAVTNLARAGALKRVVKQGGQRGIGFTEESVRAYLEGRS